MPAEAVKAGADPDGYITALIGQGLQNNQQAFVKLDAIFRPTIGDFLRRACGNHCLADELANETFLRAYRSLTSFRGRGQRQFQSFLFTIAANLLRDHYRTQKQSQATPPALHLLAQSVDPPSDKPLETRERAVMLRQALASLPPRQAKLIRLAHLKGLKAERIATILGKPSAQAVRTALCRAMKDLRAALDRQGYFDQVPA